MIEWAYKVPNNGLIRYYMVGNLERVLLTNPKALSELLVTKVYEFPKPQMVRQSLARVTGKHGVLLVEGDEHKVSGLCWSEHESQTHGAASCRSNERILCRRSHTAT
jgi:hypothetical protein